jgi:hypothetical protein
MSKLSKPVFLDMYNYTSEEELSQKWYAYRIRIKVNATLALKEFAILHCILQQAIGDTSHFAKHHSLTQPPALYFMAKSDQSLAHFTKGSKICRHGR